MPSAPASVIRLAVLGALLALACTAPAAARTDRADSVRVGFAPVSRTWFHRPSVCGAPIPGGGMVISGSG